MNLHRWFPTAFATLVASGLLCMSARAQVNAPADASLRLELVRRLDLLATKLEIEADKSKVVVESLKSSPAADTGLVLRAAADRGSFVASAVDDLVSFPEDRSPPMEVAETSHAFAISAAGDRAGALQSYAKNVRTLADAARVEPLGQVLALVEKSYVPDLAAIVIAPETAGTSLPDELTPFSAPSESGGGLLPYIVGLGATTVDYPAVAAILYHDQTTGELSVSCTGTLVSPNVVLTAEHCVNKATPIAVYFQHAGTFKVTDVEPFTPFKTFVFPIGDLALLDLARPVLGITPVALNEKSPLSTSAGGSIVGYGYRSGNTTATPGTANLANLVRKTGIKVHASISTTPCLGKLAKKKLICWTFTDREHSTLAGSTCEGDSGGPLFLDGKTLAGTTSGGGNCLPGDTAVDTEIYYYASWIKDRIKHHVFPRSSPTMALRTLEPTINDVKRFIVASSDRFFDDSHQWATTFSVPTGLTALRVAVNATTSGSSLHLKVEASDSSASCDQSTDDTAVTCELAAPTAGAWKLTVAGFPWQEYQVVATTF